MILGALLNTVKTPVNGCVALDCAVEGDAGYESLHHLSECPKSTANSFAFIGRITAAAKGNFGELCLLWQVIREHSTNTLITWKLGKSQTYS